MPDISFPQVGGAATGAAASGGLASALGGIAGPVGAGLSAAQALMGLYQGYSNMLMERRKYNNLQDAGNYAREGQGFQRDLLLSIFPELRQNLLTQQNVGNLLALGDPENPGALLQALNQVTQNPQLINQLFAGLGVNPDQAQWIDQLGGWAGQDRGIGEQLSGSGAQAQQQYGQLGDFFSNLLNGGMPQSQMNAGTDLLDNRGNTGDSNFLRDRLSEIFATGGKNADLTSLMQLALGGAATGGVTPELQQALTKSLELMTTNNQANQLGLQTATDILKNGGATPVSDQVNQIGLNKYGREALMPTSQAIGYLSNVLGSNALTNANAAAKRSEAMGGGPGVILGSGAKDQARRDASEAGLRTTADALSNQLLKQQELALQDVGQGLSGINAGNNISQGRLNTGAGLLDSMLGRDLQRTSTGISGLNSAQDSINNRLGMFLNTGMQGTGQASNNVQNAISGSLGNQGQISNNLNTGNNLMNSYWQNMFGAANGLGNAAQGNLNTAGMGLNFNQNASNMMGQGLNGTNSSIGLNASNIMNYLNSQNANTGNLMNLGNTFLQSQQNAMNGMTNLTGVFNNGFSGLINTLMGGFR